MEDYIEDLLIRADGDELEATFYGNDDGDDFSDI